MEYDQMCSGRGRCSETSLARGLPHGSLPSKSCPVHPAGRKPPFSMWHGGTPSRLEHLRTFGARSFVHEERYAKKIYVKARERRMVGYGKDSKTYWIWESGTKIVESRNVTFIKTLPVTLSAFDHDHNDYNGDTFLDLESSSFSLRKQQEIPETESDAELDTGDSHSGGTISDVDEESDSDIGSRPSEAAEPKRVARHLGKLGDYNKGLASANVTAIYPSTLDYVDIIGHPLLDKPNVCKI